MFDAEVGDQALAQHHRVECDSDHRVDDIDDDLDERAALDSRSNVEDRASSHATGGQDDT